MLRAAARVELGLIALAALVAVGARGGFPDAARALFALLSGSALLVTALADRDAALRVARSPLVLSLGTIATLAVASALWTTGEVADAVRYGLVVAGYAAVAVCAAVISRRRSGRAAILATITALAAVSGVVGLIGAGVQEFPYGQRVGGSWEAAGTFEYAPANALLQLAALPVLLSAMAGTRRTLAIAATAGAAVAGAVIGLSDSLYNEVGAVAVLGAAIAFPRVTVHSARRVAVAAALLVGAAAIVAHLIAGRYSPPCAFGGDAARLGGMAAMLVAAPALWALARRGLLAERRSARGPLLALAVAALLALGGLVAGPAGSCSAPTEGIEPYAGLLHGRIGLWGAALDVAGDHPILGSGADTYGLASAPYQDRSHVLYAHQLPLELGAELGLLGWLAALGLYTATAVALWRARGSWALWLAGPAVVAFMLANLVDFPWHLAGAAAVWALAAGVILAASRPTTGAASEQRQSGSSDAQGP